MKKGFATISSVLLLSGILSAGLSSLPAYAQTSSQTEPETSFANTIETIAFFEPHGYAVRVFEENQQFKINLYNQRSRTLELNGAPVTRQTTPEGTVYLYLGDLAARVLVANDGTEQLSFGDGPAVGSEVDDSSAIAETKLKIDSDTAAFRDRTLQSGPIQLNVSYTPSNSQATDAGENLEYQISYEGNQNPDAIVTANVGAYNYANLSLNDLDSDGTAEAIVQNYSGGAHCCTNTAVYSWQGNGFKTVETGHLDGLGGEFKDLDGDGLSEYISSDNRFLYLFSSYAGSYPPPLVSTFKGGEFTETTRQHPSVIREQIAQVEESFANPDFEGELNGALAGYVAMKSLVGEYDEGWAYMLERYDRESEWGLEIRDENGEEVGTYPDFPTALEAFLKETGYR